MNTKRIAGCLAGIISLEVLLLCLLGGISWVGAEAYKDMPRLVSGIDFGAYSPEEYTYSPDQTDVIDEIGYPRSFSILFYHDEDSDGDQVYVRYENWFYPDLGVSLTFENGTLVSEESMESYAPISTRYQPAMFTAFMDRESLAAAAEIEEWFILPVEEELLVDADLYFAEGLTFGLQAGDLVYLEAVGFEDPDAPTVVLPEEPEPTQTKVPFATQQPPAGENQPTSEPAGAPASLPAEVQAALGTYAYSFIGYEDFIPFGCISYPTEFYFEGDILKMVEFDEVYDLTHLEENYYSTNMEGVEITITFTPTGYQYWGIENDITYEIYAIREPSDDLQITSYSTLSEEETSNQGTNTYRADYCSGGEVYYSEQFTLTNTFTQNSVSLVEKSSLGNFYKIGTNYYMDEEEEGFEMIFTRNGFIWRWWDDELQDFSFVIFTLE